MGMYTEFHFNAELKHNTPTEVLGILRYMTGATDTKPKVLPDHPLFGDTRWRGMLQSDSYYFPMVPYSILKIDDLNGRERLMYFLSIRCNFKNYDDEINKFIDWITPYIDEYSPRLLGFYRYEEDEEPTLIYKQGNFKPEHC